MLRSPADDTGAESRVVVSFYPSFADCPYSDDVLVRSYEYGWGGSGDSLYPSQEAGTTWRKTTDPAGIVEYAFRDNLGRDLRLIVSFR